MAGLRARATEPSALPPGVVVVVVVVVEVGVVVVVVVVVVGGVVLVVVVVVVGVVDVAVVDVVVLPPPQAVAINATISRDTIINNKDLVFTSVLLLSHVCYQTA